MKSWIVGLLKDETGCPSSKRFVGIVCSLSLCVALFINCCSHGDIKPSDAVVNAVALLAFGCLGLSSVDKFTKAKKDIVEAVKEEENDQT